MTSVPGLGEPLSENWLLADNPPCKLLVKINPSLKQYEPHGDLDEEQLGSLLLMDTARRCAPVKAVPAGNRSCGGLKELEKPWVQLGELVWSCRLYPEGSFAALITGIWQQSFKD